MKVTTSTGVIIDNEEGLSKELTQHALRKGFDNWIVAIATFPNEVKTYVIIEDGEVIKEDQSAESIACFIDISKFAIQSDLKEKNNVSD